MATNTLSPRHYTVTCGNVTYSSIANYPKCVLVVISPVLCATYVLGLTVQWAHLVVIVD
jgi:hypothetical protein